MWGNQTAHWHPELPRAPWSREKRGVEYKRMTEVHSWKEKRWDWMIVEDMGPVVTLEASRIEFSQTWINNDSGICLEGRNRDQEHVLLSAWSSLEFLYCNPAWALSKYFVTLLVECNRNQTLLPLQLKYTSPLWSSLLLLKTQRDKFSVSSRALCPKMTFLILRPYSTLDKNQHSSTLQIWVMNARQFKYYLRASRSWICF